MIVRSADSGRLFRFAYLGTLLLGVVFLPLVSAPAEAQKTPAATPAEPQDDAESFLPNAVELQGATLSVGAVAFSPDGKRLAMGAGWVDQPYGELRLWDTDKGRMIATVPAAKGLRSVAYSTDNKNLASGELDGTVKLRDPKTGEVRATLNGHTVGVNSVAFSPDGKWLAAARLDNFVTVWDVGRRKQRLRLKGHTGPVVCVAFSPDGKLLATGDIDGKIKLWSTTNGREMASLEGHRDLILGLHFSPDGRTLLSAGKDETARLWQVITKESVLSPVARR